MRALRRFTVRASLPETLAPLGELIANLRWSWNAPTTDLFASVDPDMWEACGHDPVRLLGAVSADRLEELASDDRFLSRLHSVHEDLQRYLTEPRWYQSRENVPSCIAYFSPEFGITGVLPQYSGGLGILAGDHLKAASDLGVPILGVGLLYRAGYFAQSLSSDGWQEEHYPSLDPYGLPPLTRLAEADGSPVLIAIDLPDGRTLRAQIWQAAVGRVPLLLLDSDIEANAAAERHVTDRLYGGNAEHRLLQELLLGIGGVRAIRAWCERHPDARAPEVFHTNEGHAGFLGLERIRELMEADPGLSFDEALQAVRAGTVFTTHTPVPAGIDRFGRELIERTFAATLPTVPLDRVVGLGAEDDPGLFNMAHMGLRLAQRANGVSQLHGDVSRGMFATLWPGFEQSEIPIGHVTNGVHGPTWVHRDLFDLARKYGGQAIISSARNWEDVERVPADEIWSLRRRLRVELIGEVRRRLRTSLLHRGHHEAELGWVDSAFDPDVLTIGFARRAATYKRLTLMLHDPDRLSLLLTDLDRPVQIIVAGKAHPADDGGKALIQQMVRFVDDPAVRHRIVFIPDYDIKLANYLYAGCDVWLNNPERPREACGTSGMKSALNGGLNVSIRDGWWDEMFDGNNGWAIPTADGVADHERRDQLESAALYDLLEKEVRPRFYDLDSEGVPTRWVAMVRHTLRSLGPKALATRMVRDYVNDLYTPAEHAAARLAADSFAGARALAAWRESVVAGWGEVQVAHVESAGVGDRPELGATLQLRAEVVLGGLSPSDVRVEACYGQVDEHDELQTVECSPMTFVGNGGRIAHYEATVPLSRAGSFGYTVRVLPQHALLSSPAELGLVALA